MNSRGKLASKSNFHFSLWHMLCMRHVWVLCCRVKAELEDTKHKIKNDNEDDVSPLRSSFSGCATLFYVEHLQVNVSSARGVLTPCFVPTERRAYSAEKAIHQGGDGQSLDGEEPVQGEADGAAGSCQMDRDDPVRLQETQCELHGSPWILPSRMKYSWRENERCVEPSRAVGGLRYDSSGAVLMQENCSLDFYSSRASKENPTLQEKKKSSLWQL